MACVVKLSSLDHDVQGEEEEKIYHYAEICKFIVPFFTKKLEHEGRIKKDVGGWKSV